MQQDWGARGLLQNPHSQVQLLHLSRALFRPVTPSEQPRRIWSVSCSKRQSGFDIMRHLHVEQTDFLAALAPTALPVMRLQV